MSGAWQVSWQKKDRIDAVFINADKSPYGGKARFIVSHPEQKTVRVAAPDENSAIVAASSVWGVPWTRYDIYSEATVRRDY